MNKLKVSHPYIFPSINRKLQNRTVLAAMTNKQSYDNGVISDDEIKWLLERAKGGFGIITTAATNVSKEGKAWDGEFGVYDNYQDKLRMAAFKAMKKEAGFIGFAND